MKQNRLCITFFCVLIALLGLVIFIPIGSVSASAAGSPVDYTLGDVNNDSEVNSADAIWLLRHTLFPSRYQLHTSVYFYITWKNHDGTVISTTSVPLGSTPTYSGTTPSKEGTEQVAYTFKGWSPSVSVAKGDATYTAQFEEGVRTYTVTWKDYDGGERKAFIISTDIQGLDFNNRANYPDLMQKIIDTVESMRTVFQQQLNIGQ